MMQESKHIILGGGLAGLSAGNELSHAGQQVAVFEGGSQVGGLSRTVRHGQFLFDLGGHRFFTRNKTTELFVKEILDGDYLTVTRKSKIYLRDRFFDYPLKPSNALLGLGIPTTARAISDYGKEKIRGLVASSPNISLEDWVVRHFGRTMFTIYFKEYSEKVWGIECSRISEEWVSQRIQGLSLGVAIRNAFFRFAGGQVSTLADKFIYPPKGIGQISDGLKRRIEEDGGKVSTDTRIVGIYHRDSTVSHVSARNGNHEYQVKGEEFISSIPLTHLLNMLDPAPPEDVLRAAAQLRYRDLVIVTVMLNRQRVTDLTWIYIPEQNMPLGRIHEPTNWSPHMAPPGKTHIVSEYFCFQNDHIWNAKDSELVAMTTSQLEKLGFISGRDVIDSCVIRIPGAYPLFEVGYAEHYRTIEDYLRTFRNLHIAGRTGMFRYYNMDRAIESGLDVARAVLKKTSSAVQEALPLGV